MYVCTHTYGMIVFMYNSRKKSQMYNSYVQQCMMKVRNLLQSNIMEFFIDTHVLYFEYGGN